MNLLFLDIETAGLDPQENQILEISADLYQDGKYVENFSQIAFVNLTNEVSLGALRVNGRKINEGVKEKITETAMLYNFSDWLVSKVRSVGEFFVVGHNVHFDLTFLRIRLENMGITGFESIVGHRYLDTTSVALFLMDSGLLPEVKKPTIEELAKVFGTGVPAHNAVRDTVDIYRIYQCMKGLVK